MKVSYGRAVFVALAFGSLMVAGANMASAQSAGQVIKERRDLMKGMSGNVKAIVAYMKKGEGSAADVGTRARRIAAWAAQIPDLYPKGTSLSDGVGKTRAKPEIWLQRAKFEGAAANMSKIAWDLSAAAGTGNKQAIGGVMKTFGKMGCGGCHGAFRGPKPK